MITSVFHSIAFFWLAKRCRWKPKTRLTVAVTYGMLMALILRLMIAYIVWKSVVGN